MKPNYGKAWDGAAIVNALSIRNIGVSETGVCPDCESAEFWFDPSDVSRECKECGLLYGADGDSEPTSKAERHEYAMEIDADWR